MKFIQDLKPLRLYSKKKSVFIPFDPKNKRKGAAILLLTPSLESSLKCMSLPYFYYSKYFQGYYADRNVDAYIDSGGIVDTSDIDDDVDEEETDEMIAEALMYKTSKSKIEYDGSSIGSEVYLKNTKSKIKDYAKYVDVNLESAIKYHFCNRPEEIKTEVLKYHPGEEINNEALSYSVSYDVFVLNYTGWNKATGEFDTTAYQLYLDSETLCCIMNLRNAEADKTNLGAISAVLTGAYEYYAGKKILDKNFEETCCTISIMIDKEGYLKSKRKIRSMITDNNFMHITKYAWANSKKLLLKVGSNLIKEEALTASQKKELKDSDYGLPSKKKYPMPDASHVKAAIRMFNYVDEKDEAELAKNINKKIKQFDVEVSVGDNNRFKKYYKPISEAAKDDKEAVSLPSKYDEVLKICKSLSPKEFAYISFTPVYQNSPNVIHRHIEYIGDKPAGFLDVYQFKTKPGVVYITLAVSPYYRRQGVADKMVKTVLNSNLPEKYKFNTWIWDASTENVPSQKTAEKNGFKRDADLDDYGRYQYRLYLNPNSKVPLPDGYVVINSDGKNEGYLVNDQYASIQTEQFSMISFFNNSNSTVFNEVEKKYDSRLRRYLYRERIRNNKQVLMIYKDVKERNPNIRKTFLTLKKYNGFNIYYDLHYYNSLFLKNNILKMDKGVNMYLDFITRLINNSELGEYYKYQTILIPVDSEDWGVPRGEDITDFRRYTNPISMIVRLVRRNPDSLKKVFGGKRIIFVGTEGYFFIDFNNFSMKHLNRFRKALKKLSSGEVVVDGDDIEPDEEASVDDYTDEDSNSSAALTASVVDKIESKTGIELPDISSAVKQDKSSKKESLGIENLRIRHIDIKIPNVSKGKENGVAVILMSPNSTASASISTNGPIRNSNIIDAYLVNK